MNRAAGRAAALVVICATPCAGEPLKVEPGHPIDLTCTTQSVVVAPTAATSKGSSTLRLEARENGPVWIVKDVASEHTAAIAGRHRTACAQGCPLVAAPDKPYELWAPQRAAPGSLPAGEPLSVATIDRATLKFRASTFIDKDIAALEQGECSVITPAQ